MNEKAKEASRNAIEIGLTEIEIWMNKEMFNYQNLSHITLCELRLKVDKLQAKANQKWLENRDKN